MGSSRKPKTHPSSALTGGEPVSIGTAPAGPAQKQDQQEEPTLIAELVNVDPRTVAATGQGEGISLRRNEAVTGVYVKAGRLGDLKPPDAAEVQQQRLRRGAIYSLSRNPLWAVVAFSR